MVKMKKIAVPAMVLGFCRVALGQPATEAEQSTLPILALEVALPSDTFEVREPIVPHVTLANQGAAPVTIKVAPDGAPLGTALEVLEPDGQWTHHSLLLRKLPPQGRAIDLQAGQSTGGEVFALADYESGYVFTTSGQYKVRWVSYLRNGHEKLYSEELLVTILAASRANSLFLSALELGPAARYYGGGQRPTDAELTRPEIMAELERYGARLIGYVVSQQSPHLVEPQRSADDQREAVLVEGLARLLDEHPDSLYVGYIARFLGLVHLKTLEHEGSLEGWGERDRERVRAHPAYAKALRYLTMARDAEVWPRTAALENLAFLHLVAQEWDKASEHVRALREGCADIGGVEIADKLDLEINRFRTKMEARQANEAATP